MRSGSRGLLGALDRDILSLIDRALDFGRRGAIDLFLVGGAVRDLLIDEQVRDLDLVWVGDGEAEATSRRFAEHLNSSLSYHPEFMTARLEGPGGARLDLGRARSESYRAPAALPAVRPAGLTEDLMRRDFSVNALAVPLARPEEMIDPAAGLPDLEGGKLRILHGRSFQDDPTRILRGLELIARRGFDFDAATRSRAEEAIAEGRLALLSGARVSHELTRLFASTERAVAAAGRLRAFGIDRALHPEFRIEDDDLARLRRLSGWHASKQAEVDSVAAPLWILTLTVLLFEAPRSTRTGLARRLGLARSRRRWLEDVPERLGPLIESGAAVDSSLVDMVELYSRLTADEARLLEKLAGPGDTPRLNELRRAASVDLEIDGDRLLAAGIDPGPRVGAALGATLAARRAGAIEAHEELDFALRWLRREGH